MSNYELAFARNLGFISQAEQDKLSETSVAIAGAGGDGGELAVLLARMGFGEIRLADPDPFEIENINRQAVCTTRTVGMNKAVAVVVGVGIAKVTTPVLSYIMGWKTPSQHP